MKNKTYWERAAKKMAKAHLRIMAAVTSGGASDAEVRKSVEHAEKILEVRP